MRDVAYVGPVKEVVVGADLEARLPLSAGLEETGDCLNVAFTKDAGGTDGAGEKGFVGFAIGCEDT